MTIENKWMFNCTSDGVWNREDFPTKEEAVKAAIKFAKEDYRKVMYVGQAITMPLPDPTDASTLLERAAEILDEDGSEWEAGDMFFDNITEEQTADLEAMLQETWWKWVEKHKIESGSYIMNNVEEIKTAPDCQMEGC